MRDLSNQLKFTKVKTRTKAFSHLRNYFNSQISKLYGSQEKALQKIADDKDRVCELLQASSSKDLGIIVYKSQLTSKFKDYSCEDVFEIKTLFVINPKKNSGKRIATHLLNHLVQIACDLKAKNLFVSVSSKRPESLAFFLSQGFCIEKVKNDLYLDGLDEYFLIHNSPTNLLAKTTCELLLPDNQRTFLKTTKSYFDNCDFIPKNEKEVEAFARKRDSSRILYGCYGIKVSKKFSEESLVKLRSLALRWQVKKPSNHYAIIFLNQLYDDFGKKKQIGDILVGITANGERHLLGCCPSGPLPTIYWRQIFKDLQTRGIKKVDILCPHTKQNISEAIKQSFSQIKVEKTPTPKSWFLQSLVPSSSGYEVTSELVNAGDIVLKKEMAHLV